MLVFCSKWKGFPVLLCFTMLTIGSGGDQQDMSWVKTKYIMEQFPRDIEPVAVSPNKIYLRDRSNTMVTFGGYLNFCNQHKLNVASIMNQDEQNVMEEFFKKGTYNYHMWLGAWDANQLGHWTWINSGASINNFTNWRPTEPNTDNWNCMRIDRYNFQWYDADCAVSTGVSLCELNVQTSNCFTVIDQQTEQY